jgi:epoxyqueuosine reductase
MTAAAKAQLVKDLGRQIGFDLVGITVPAPAAGAAYYRRWLAAGYAARMHYLAQNVRIREQPALLLPGARSVICVAVNYKRSDGYERSPATPPRHPTGPMGRIAQYARGRDYHLVLREMLHTLVERLRLHLHEPFEARCFVDTGPVLERELAAAAGLGWIGRNTCLINAQLGSYVLLGEVITTLELAPDSPVPARCGTCTRCLDRCPTQALVAPHTLDASRCIAYLTIEHRAEIPANLHRSLGSWLFGCDECQQVCPYNARAPLGTCSGLTEDRVPAWLPVAPLVELSSSDYRRLTRDTALCRATRGMWQRTARLVLNNAG